MANAFLLTGTIKKLTINEPKDPQNSKRQASAVLLVQYGVQREVSGGAVEFVNAALVRVPSYKFSHYRGRLRSGQGVEIVGHLQGIYKNFAEQGFFTVELVADRIDIVSDPAVAADAPAPEAAAEG